MPDKSNNPFKFLEELKRRRVIRVIPVYAAAAFVLLDLVDIISEPFGLPGWTLKLVVVLLVIGFVISIVLTWIYDFTPEGIEKTKPSEEVTGSEKQPASTGWKITSFVSILIIIAFIVFNIVGNNKKSSAISELEKSIAVLPFENMCDDDEFAHLGDAITDEIIMQLYKINEFDVRSRTSIMQYKNTGKTSPVIGEELKVNYILEGSTQKYEDQVRIRIQLIQASADDHIWGDIFEGEWNDIFNIQIDVAKQVAKELKAVLSPEEIEKIDKQPTNNIEAYNLYLKGRFFWHRRTKEDLIKSTEYFTQALELDTSYALAYAGLADAYFIMAYYGWHSKDEGYNTGKEYAIKALSINNNIAEAHATLGGIYAWYDWKWEKAEKEHILAISLNPNYATAHQYYAELLDILGRNKEARDQIDIALKLSPYSYAINVMSFLIYYHNSDFRKSLEASLKTLEIVDNIGIKLQILECYVRLGLDKNAIQEIKNIISIHGSTEQLTDLNVIYQKSGIEGIINWYIDWLILNVPSAFYTIASFYGIVGDSQKAIEYLKKGMEFGYPNMPRINNNPDFDILKEDPRFIAMLKEMNLK